MRHPILSKLDASRARLLQGIANLPDDTLDAQPDGGGWTIREHLTHLVASEEDHGHVIEAIARGQLDRLPGQVDRDPHNSQRLDEIGILSLSQLLDAMAAQRQRTETLFAKLDPAQLELTGPHPVLGDMTVGGIFRILAIHEQMHTREILAIRSRIDAG